MSRIPSGSSAGMQVAAQPSNSVYTLLTIIAMVCLLGTVVFVTLRADENFGWAFPAGERYEKSLKDHETKMTEMGDKTDEAEKALKSVSLNLVRVGASTQKDDSTQQQPPLPVQE